ncbi:MAG: F0F1 ATP synthase subunit epsilon [Desulfovibrionales bacterium]
MKMTVYVPAEIFETTEDAVKVVAEGPVGGFGILPQHIDMASPLVPGILSYVTRESGEQFLAVDFGMLVKQGDEVKISVRSAARGDLGRLQQAVQRMSQDVDEKEKAVQSAVAKLEANFVRRFLELGKNV